MFVFANIIFFTDIDTYVKQNTNPYLNFYKVKNGKKLRIQPDIISNNNNNNYNNSTAYYIILQYYIFCSNESNKV